MVVDQGVLQHACLETQVSDMLPHPSLATLLIVPERKQREKGGKTFSDNSGMTEVSGILDKIYVFLAFKLILVYSYGGLFIFI